MIGGAHGLGYAIGYYGWVCCLVVPALVVLVFVLRAVRRRR